MKKSYVTPETRKVEFSYDDHVLAAGSGQVPIGNYTDPTSAGICQYNASDCSKIYIATYATYPTGCKFGPD